MTSVSDRYVDYRPDRPYYPSQFDVDKIWPEMPYERRMALGFMSDDATGTFNQNVREQVRLGINSGEFAGLGAFEAIGKTALCQQIYHGSPRTPEQLDGKKLTPSQPVWRDASGKQYLDGLKAVCFTPNLDIAKFMAMLGGHRPELRDQRRGYMRSPSGRLWMMMSEGILKSIEDLSGCVYTKPLSSVPKWQFNQTGREDEYRSLTDTDYDYAVRVDHTCLPADTLVIGGSNQVISSIWDAVKSGVHPLDVSTGTGTITTLSGVWSVEDHPDYRQRV